MEGGRVVVDAAPNAMAWGGNKMCVFAGWAGGWLVGLAMCNTVQLDIHIYVCCDETPKLVLGKVFGASCPCFTKADTNCAKGWAVKSATTRPPRPP